MALRVAVARRVRARSRRGPSVGEGSRGVGRPVRDPGRRVARVRAGHPARARREARPARARRRARDAQLAPRSSRARDATLAPLGSPAARAPCARARSGRDALGHARAGRTAARAERRPARLGVRLPELRAARPRRDTRSSRHWIDVERAEQGDLAQARLGARRTSRGSSTRATRASRPRIRGRGSPAA